MNAHVSEPKSVDAAALAQLFTEARTHNEFSDRPVSDALLQKAVDLAKMGPTSANQSPMRIVFVKSAEAKAKLLPAMSEGNRAKTGAAPVTAIVAFDEKFYEHLPFLFPHADAKSWFSGNEAFAKRAAFQNGTLQAAYLILALRAVGLDTGPMTGFDNASVDAAFFAGTDVKSNVIINIGYGDVAKLFPRSPRFAFDQIAKIV
ncbi:MAG TPA: malonic semialdehyde reductase [Roseiarcus sp.]|nr:malonic semialdehyde reductase [Roseiarcus sp.]